MRSEIHSPTEFFKRMKKKPALQAIIDDLDRMTEKDIDACDQPLWIRKELKNLKESERPEGYLTPEEIADIMMQSGESGKN